MTVCVRFQDSRNRESGNIPDQFQIVFNGLKIDLQPGFISFICHTLYFTLKKVTCLQVFDVHYHLDTVNRTDLMPQKKSREKLI